MAGYEGHEDRKEEQKEHYRWDGAEDRHGDRETEKHNQQGSCEKPPPATGQPQHASILA
jgi:hypothetical protein